MAWGFKEPFPGQVMTWCGQPVCHVDSPIECEFHRWEREKAMRGREMEKMEIRGFRLPHDPVARKEIPLATGVLDYFPDALTAVAKVSQAGNQQHNPGTPLHWDRSKSGDEADALMRHFIERGTFDDDGLRHSAKMAWRALALLQKEIEGEEQK